MTHPHASPNAIFATRKSKRAKSTRSELFDPLPEIGSAEMPVMTLVVKSARG